MTTKIKITDATDYKWIEVGEVYSVTERSQYGFYIKVFGVEFHVLEDDSELVESTCVTDYEQLEISTEASLKVIEETVEFEATLHQPNYRDAISQLIGISLVLIPFPELQKKIDDKIDEIESVRRKFKRL